MADDRTFIRRFSGIILGLVVFTVLIIVLAVSFQNDPDPTDNPSQLTFAEQRIKPVAAVRTTAGSETTAQAPVEAEPVAESVVSGPFDGSLDGELIYDRVCAACHTAGVAGAPVPGTTMAERAGKGLDVLVVNAINGINIMPPRGGRNDLTDEQVAAAVEYMLQP